MRNLKSIFKLCGNVSSGGGGGSANEPKGRGIKNFKSNYIIPNIKNPANIPNNAITEDEYLAAKGFGSPISDYYIDKVGGANMTRLSQRQREKTFKEIEKKQQEYAADRQKVREEYRQLVQQGVIRDKTAIEKVITKAHGNPELASTQAARRMADKRGIDWKTGKKKKKSK